MSRRRLLVGILPALLLSACVAQSGARKAPFRTEAPAISGTNSASGATASITTLSITNVTITTNDKFQLSFERHAGSSLSSTNVSAFCQAASANCQCIFRWNENNTTSPGPAITSEAQVLSFERRAITTVVTSQPALAECEAPAVYASEIGVGEQIRISVEPVSDSGVFKTNTYTFTKPGLDRDASSKGFEDDQGNVFNDVWRYVCHESIRRGVGFTSKTSTVTRQPNFNRGGGYSETLGFALASQFSVETAENANSRLSAQLNYFNLYAAANKLVVNPDNAAFSCPKVATGRIRPANGPAADKLYFPFDSSFALASRSSKTFNIPVEARSRLSGAGADSSTHRFCDPKKTSEATLGRNSLVIDCLGFAARPKSDGTCPLITVRLRNPDGSYKKNANQQILTQTRQTYRLRRFTALYPALYDTNGAWIENYRTKSDQIYVLDRPATFSTGSGTVQGTILGPKPCPFAWWDWSSALTANTVGYYSTNDDRWKGRNPDGIRFPTEHIDGQSCPAALPYRTSDGKFLIRSLTPGSPEAQVRPIQNPWEPIYWEDQAFLACAPEDEPTTRVRAPLHHRVSSDGSTASYCEEVYPTEHLGIRTSHRLPVVSSIDGSCTGPNCEHYPLLAPLDGIEKALENTKFYGCQATSAPGPSVVSSEGFATVGGAARCCNNFNFTSTFSHSDEASNRCQWAP